MKTFSFGELITKNIVTSFAELEAQRLAVEENRIRLLRLSRLSDDFEHLSHNILTSEELEDKVSALQNLVGEFQERLTEAVKSVVKSKSTGKSIKDKLIYKER